MKQTDAFGDLVQLGRPVIETREAAVRLGVSISRASQILGSLEKSGLVRRLHRGLWTLRLDIDPYSLPPYLTAPFPSYVSFWSALARHGMIEQIPKQVFVASIGRSQRVATTLGRYSIHHLAPEVFGGFHGSEEFGYIATPEKALFDTIYLRAPRGGQMSVPELELPKRFKKERLTKWVRRISRPSLRTRVSRELEGALAQAATSS
jgi:predicted transcriptional regulator of viral defense system